MFGEYIADFITGSWVIMALVFITVAMFGGLVAALVLELYRTIVEAIQTLRIKK